METKTNLVQRWAIGFDHTANRITPLTGSLGAFLTAFAVVGIWVLTGPLFGYSDDWQLVINTGTPIITF